MRLLTLREVQAVELVADGFTNRQIGARMHLSEDSVRWMLVCLFRRLDLRDRAHLVAWAFRHGYLLVDGRRPKFRTVRPPRALQPHGTHGAAERHRYHGEELCRVCREGERERDRVRKRAKRATSGPTLGRTA